MGRYYDGDISGKFWFAIQNSNAADRFGVTGNQPGELEYFFDENNLSEVEEEIKNIETQLGEKLQEIEDFFKEKESYSDKQLEEANISNTDLSEYADLLLGRKIKNCLEAQGTCSFQAEL